MPRHIRPTVRLFVDRELAAATVVALDRPQAHYLVRVMRFGVGDGVDLFNGCDGEWHAKIAALGKGEAVLEVREQLRPQDRVEDLWLVLAPIKSARMSIVVEKATELGIGTMVPVITQNTAVKRVNLERLRAHAVEAAEQCGRLSVPEVRRPQPLHSLLEDWPRNRLLVFCDESGPANSLIDVLVDRRAEYCGKAWAILIGPEGGFAPAEVEAFWRHPFIVPARLGPRILRADTAAVAALSLWQSVVGDWRDGTPA